jgi:hypothetical protein
VHLIDAIAKRGCEAQIAMPKRVTIEPHLSVKELENGYRQASEPVKRSHYQIIWLLAKGMRTQEVVAATGYSRSWIYELVWGYRSFITLGRG